MRCYHFLLYIFLFALIPLGPDALGQWNYYHQYGLLPEAMLDEMIGESSGEQAFQHIVEMSGYNRSRPLEEYSTTLMEAQYVLDKLNEYGIAGAQIERVGKTSTWKGLEGKLWETNPRRTKILDYDDSPLFLASGSKNADVEAELIWILDGREEAIKGVGPENLKGKIVVTSGSLRNINSWIGHGALGAISFESSVPLIDPLQIPTGGMWSRGEKGFAFRIPPRDGHKLRDRLIRGEKITVHAKVETTQVELDMQVPTCVIPGTEPNGDEVIICAHIFEGYVKQGANDNISGSAAILEVARVLQTLYKEERIPRPKRTIRFIWVPEFSGTIPWVKKHADIMEKTLCNINLDMVGLEKASNQSFLNLHRTTMGNSHYINDVMECYMRYISENNKVRDTPIGRFDFLKPITAPTGTWDPFYYNTEAYIGASDHAVFNDWAVGVPGILLNDWPDHYYHTSNDRPWVCDPTQMKRAVFLTVAATYSIAAADHTISMRLASEIIGNAQHRLGHQVTLSCDNISKSTPELLPNVYKKAVYDVDASFLNEKETLISVKELISEEKSLELLKQKVEIFTGIYEQNRKILHTMMLGRAMELEMKPVELKETKLEKQAKMIVPVPTDLVKASGYRGYQEAFRSVPEDMLQKYPYPSVSRYSRELNLLCNGQHSALDIKKMIDVQQPNNVELQDVINYIEVLKLAGLVKNL